MVHDSGMTSDMTKRNQECPNNLELVLNNWTYLEQRLKQYSEGKQKEAKKKSKDSF